MRPSAPPLLLILVLGLPMTATSLRPAFCSPCLSPLRAGSGSRGTQVNRGCASLPVRMLPTGPGVGGGGRGLKLAGGISMKDPLPDVIDVCGDSGCLKRIVKEGEGDSFPQRGDFVRLHYTISSQGNVLDSSRERGVEFEFQLGNKPSDAMPGWEAAVPTMKQGETAKVLCKPEYAYGEKGAPPLIKGNTTLVCELEVLGWGPEPVGAAKKEREGQREREESERVRRQQLAEKYTPSDAPESDVYQKYKGDMASGALNNDFNLTASGKKKEVFDLDDIRLRALSSRDQRVRGRAEGYQWDETEKTLDLYVAVPNGTRAQDVTCNFTNTHIEVCVGGGRLLGGRLCGKVLAGDCVWVLGEAGGQAHVHVMLRKIRQDIKIWGGVLEPAQGAAEGGAEPEEGRGGAHEGETTES